MPASSDTAVAPTPAIPRSTLLLSWSVVAWMVGLLLSDGFEPDAYGQVTEAFLAWPVAPVVQVLVASIAFWLSVSRWHTRTRIRNAAWILGGATCVLAILRPSIVEVAMGWVVQDLRTLSGPEPLPADAASSPTTGDPIGCLGCGATLSGDAERCGACGWTFAT